MPRNCKLLHIRKFNQLKYVTMIFKVSVLTRVNVFVFLRPGDQRSRVLPGMRVVLHDLEVGIPAVLFRSSLQTML